ncbi:MULTISPECIES: hypothetical protein [unclassified Rhodococcus (in: high G+C Gram-positive bacteria)]|uniref:hypothetical protein n=1 Tax=unclassified Rhodococcus (in: high G+C Gram-positive bacteria) TaxID=192944 RepID=UPI001C6582B1|nr:MULTISPECIES: hypothetical protein [unclassified Rhodococcus (in: high G+C Gram-positive bacteria)]
MTSRGVVRSWDVGGMQGVIDSADTPGGSWTSWTSVVVHGFPGLVEGQEVEFEWNQLDEAADGYDFHTVQAWPVGEDHTPPGPPGFRAWDIDPDGTVHEVTDLDITDLDDTIAPPIGTPAIGVVTTWNGEEGWGVIDSADTPGGCWTFYSALHPDEVINARPGDSFSIGGGISALVVGEQVDFEWERSSIRTDTNFVRSRSGRGGISPRGASNESVGSSTSTARRRPLALPRTPRSARQPQPRAPSHQSPTSLAQRRRTDHARGSPWACLFVRIRARRQPSIVHRATSLPSPRISSHTLCAP